MNCAACRWWNASYDRAEWQTGQCRRHAPTVRLLVTTQSYFGNGEERGRWPETTGKDGCGDFEQLVTKAETA